MKVIWAVVLVVLVLVGAQGAKMLNTSREVERSNYSESISGNMLVYRNHVVAYAVAHPTATGEIADASLGLPAWFKKSQDVKNYVTGGRGYVYYTATQDGQTSELLRSSKGDALIGMKRGGMLFNPTLGVVSLALPTAIPEDAVVFAPPAPSAAVAPPPNCDVPAGTSRTWTVSGRTCVATQPAAQLLGHAGVLAFVDGVGPQTGAASFLCSNGTLSAAPQPGASCNDPPPADCNVTASTSRSWNVSGAACAGQAGSNATISSGSYLSISSSNGNTGTGNFLCTNGALATSPTSASCSVPPVPCTLPSPSTEVAYDSQTVTQTLACPAGYTGSITQSKLQQRTQTRSAYCPAPTGSYAWSGWSAWSGWTDTSGWTTTNNTCVALTCTGSSSQTQWVAASAACPTGQSGSNTWEKEQAQTRSCNLGAWSGWSSWSDTGATRNAVNTCKDDGAGNPPITMVAVLAETYLGVQNGGDGYAGISYDGALGSTFYCYERDDGTSCSFEFLYAKGAPHPGEWAGFCKAGDTYRNDFSQVGASRDDWIETKAEIYECRAAP